MLYILIFFAIGYVVGKFCFDQKLGLYDYFLVLFPIVAFFYQRIKYQKEKKQLIGEFDKEKEFVAGIAQTLRTTLDFNELLEMMLSILSGRLGHKGIFIYLLEKNGGNNYLKCIGFPGAINANGISALNIPHGSEMIDTIVGSKCPKITNLDSKYKTEKEISHTDKVGIVPMITRKEVVGAIIFGITQPNVNLSEVKLFAAQAAMAIDNAKLFEKIKESAITDDLTKIYNKRYLYQVLFSGVDLAKRYKSHLSVLMVDIDNFKHYNDTNGHLAGDDCLYKVAQILVSNIWKTDIAARYGGEEFVVLLHGTEKEGALIAAEKIRTAVENYHFSYGEKQPRGKVTISLGVSTYPDDAQDAMELISCADKALYNAKCTGKNKVLTC